jgi:hypothetical protein
MADIVWPTVLAALRDVASAALSPDPVFDGPPVTGDDLTTFAIVGADLDEGGAGNWSSEITTIGRPFRVQERGTVNSLVISQTGDTDIAASRTAVFIAAEKILDAVNADPSLGLSSVVAAQADTGRVVMMQTSSGAYTEVSIVLSYTAITGA